MIVRCHHLTRSNHHLNWRLLYENYISDRWMLAASPLECTKNDTIDETGLKVTHSNCLFCNVRPENGFAIVWEASAKLYCLYLRTDTKVGRTNALLCLKTTTPQLHNIYKSFLECI